MKFVVIGYGSIGKRHARNAVKLGHDVTLLRHSKSNVNGDDLKEYYSLEEAIRTEGKIDGVLICSPTSRHLRDVEMVLEHNIPFLLEKPPTGDLQSTLDMVRLIRRKGFNDFEIGFNLRYYPVLRFIKEYLSNLGEIYSARVYAGYYLPNWRKGIDYRETSSAKRELGGGVHVELSHEVDYIVWLFGVPEKVYGYVNRISKLDISTEDICSAMLQYKDGSIVEIHLDYLSHKYLRGCQIIGENGTLEWDFNDKKVVYCEKGEVSSKDIFSLDPMYDFNNTYVEELENFIRIINNEGKSGTDLESSLRVMEIVEAIVNSSKEECAVYIRK